MEEKGNDCRGQVDIPHEDHLLHLKGVAPVDLTALFLHYQAIAPLGERGALVGDVKDGHGKSPGKKRWRLDFQDEGDLAVFLFLATQAAQGGGYLGHPRLLEKPGQILLIASEEKLGFPELATELDVVLKQALELEGIQGETQGSGRGSCQRLNMKEGRRIEVAGEVKGAVAVHGGGDLGDAGPNLGAAHGVTPQAGLEEEGRVGVPAAQEEFIHHLGAML
jgi:hypothetical protein